MIFLDDWPEPGKKELGPTIEAQAVRTYELEPVLNEVAGRLERAAETFRSLQSRSNLPRIASGLREMNDAKAETAKKLTSLRTMNPSRLIADWEKLKAEYERFARSEGRLIAQGDLFSGLTEGQLAGNQRIPNFLTFVVPAITNHRLLPYRLPAGVKPGGVRELTACPGEYESGSFGVYALTDMSKTRITVTDLKRPDASIPASAVDVRTVKVWYQAGHNVGFENIRELTPELLLKDDSLVEIDVEKKVNILKMDKNAMRDADTLQPVNIPSATVKQFWLTVHVPKGAQDGDYKGSVRIDTAGAGTASLPIQLRVLPFELDEPKLICSIYYRARLGAQRPTCTSEGKTEEQLLAELKDMFAHGVTNPTTYQGIDGKRPDGPYDSTRLQRVFDLRKQAGMTGGPLLILGVGVGADPDMLRAAVDLAKKNGFTDVYFYAAHEARGERLRAQRPLFERVHKAGGKVFVAGYKDSFEIVGDLLDMPVFSGRPDPAMAVAYHSVGHKIMSYGNPQGGVEEPETYRRNYGLALWKAGYDGACTYAYQHSFGHAWDDFDSPTYRDHNMAYPTVNGVTPHRAVGGLP